MYADGPLEFDFVEWSDGMSWLVTGETGRQASRTSPTAPVASSLSASESNFASIVSGSGEFARILCARRQCSIAVNYPALKGGASCFHDALFYDGVSHRERSLHRRWVRTVPVLPVRRSRWRQWPTAHACCCVLTQGRTPTVLLHHSAAGVVSVSGRRPRPMTAIHPRPQGRGFLACNHVKPPEPLPAVRDGPSGRPRRAVRWFDVIDAPVGSPARGSTPFGRRLAARRA